MDRFKSKIASATLNGEGEQDSRPDPVKKIATVASISAGVQFGWALQLSLLTPYVQVLGIPHTWASLIWLCGPVSGMIVQPIVGYHSDRCGARWGRRKPFIAGGTGLVAVAAVLISYAMDMGRALGDPLEEGKRKTNAIVIFVVGFWILDVANNMLQGPLRAFLADLAGESHSRIRNAHALYSFFLAVGNVLGFAAGSFTRLHKLLPFTTTSACDIYCANLKTCFFLSILFLLTVTTVAFISVRENLPKPSLLVASLASENQAPKESISHICTAWRDIPKPLWALLLVLCLNYFALSTFLLYDTDWMGKEVYGGKVGDDKLYDMGVRAGALGLIFTSIVFGFSSLAIEFLSGKIGGAKRLWACGNFFLALCLGMTVVITKMAGSSGNGKAGIPPTVGVKVGTMAFFASMGIPLAVTYSIPYALASIFSNALGGGQGLTLGVLNLGIAIPQLVVSLTSGPWDALFGGGNLPAFLMGAVAAVASGILGLTILPSPPDSAPFP